MVEFSDPSEDGSSVDQEFEEEGGEAIGGGSWMRGGERGGRWRKEGEGGTEKVRGEEKRWGDATI
jgi:hypothetical protein